MARPDPALAILPVCAVLALSGVGLLVPRHAAQAAPPPTAAKPAPIMDDGDGDELLEHWGDAKYAREERIQMAGVAVGFVLLGGLSWRKRIHRQPRPIGLTLITVSDERKAA